MMYCGIYNKERGANLLLVPRFVGLRIALSAETSNDKSHATFKMIIKRA